MKGQRGGDEPDTLGDDARGQALRTSFDQQLENSQAMLVRERA